MLKSTPRYPHNFRMKTFEVTNIVTWPGVGVEAKRDQIKVGAIGVAALGPFLK